MLSGPSRARNGVFSDGLGVNLLRSEEWLKQLDDNLMSI